MEGMENKSKRADAADCYRGWMKATSKGSTRCSYLTLTSPVGSCRCINGALNGCSLAPPTGLFAGAINQRKQQGNSQTDGYNSKSKS
eukprot:jgi/Psemu1/53630/gm1.53630_g